MISSFAQETGGDQQKKSPLALLAATCSSIGKTEGKKDSLEPVINTTGRHSPKMPSSLNDVRSSKLNNTDGEKSSFKPYKQIDEKEMNHNSEKPGFRAPSKEQANDSTRNKSPEFRSKVSPHIGSSFPSFPYPYLTDVSGHCFYQGSPASSRLCGMYYDIPSPGATTAHHSTCLKSDCTGNCSPMVLPSPTSLAPTTPSMRPMFPTPPVSAPSPVKSHGLSPSSARSNPLYPRCNCGYCNQEQESTLKPGIQHLPHYHRDYLTSACQDPYCTNCKTQKTSTSSSSNHGCGPHCFGHHHHDSSSILSGSLSTVPSSMSHLYPYAGFMLRAQNDQNGPFICNWVQDSKNCGKNFTTSEELLQHLRTHTSAANASSTPLHTPCNIPGCPCGFKSSSISGPTRLHSTARYHPYFMPSPALHSPTFHSAISHYSNPHGIPYPSSLKPY